jgi:hypothetical protein
MVRLLERRQLPADTIVQAHAPEISDIVNYLAQYQYEIVQFSGHGDGGSLVVDSGDGGSFPISASRLSALIADTQPGIKAALFMSCYSSEASDELRKAAPFVIAVQGSADDELATAFSLMFLNNYLEFGSIESAFSVSQQALTMQEGVSADPVIYLTLLRRGVQTPETSVQAHVRGTTFLVDFAEAMSYLEDLQIPPSTIAQSIARKIHVHRWLFDAPREDVLLQIGRHIGRFSWQNALDIIRCTAIYAPRSDLSREDCDALYQLLVAYNDRSSLEYRTVTHPAASANIGLLERGVEELGMTLAVLRVESSFSSAIQEVAPQVLQITCANMRASLDMATEKLTRGEPGDAIYHLEAALTALHDLVNELVAQMCVQREYG